MKFAYQLFVFCAILATVVANVLKDAPMEMAVTTPAEDVSSSPVTMPQEDKEVNIQEEPATIAADTTSSATEEATALPVTTPQEQEVTPTAEQETTLTESAATEAPVPVTTPEMEEDTSTAAAEETTTILPETTNTAQDTTTAAAEESTTILPETTTIAQDTTTAAAEETTTILPETTNTEQENTTTSDLTTIETTTDLSTTTTEPYEFECIASGFYAKQNSCTEFYWCMHSGDKYMPYQLRCPEGQNFQAGPNYCNANYECALTA